MASVRWSSLGLLVAIVTSVLLAVVPWSGSSCSSTDFGAASCEATSHSLLETEGNGVLIALAVPVALAAIPLLGATGARWVGAVGLTTFAFLAGFSIGFFYLPVVALAWVAVRAGSRAHQPSPSW